MGWADRTVHVQHDILQAIAVVEAVDPPAVQFCQLCPFLGHDQRLGLELTHL